ncbi:Uncharacterised protein [[Clostridium] sordellii]|nr:Uncharacterised protein [[Clostridium] sordellii] [Paeniclostridium sordellii]
MIKEILIVALGVIIGELALDIIRYLLKRLKG